MRRLKHTFWRFREYEGAAFSKYLDEMAGKGWYLDHISTIGTLVFEKKELDGGRFCATVVPGETEFSEEESTGKQRVCLSYARDLPLDCILYAHPEKCTEG